MKKQISDMHTYGVLIGSSMSNQVTEQFSHSFKMNIIFKSYFMTLWMQLIILGVICL